jgi:hypothetical protein
MGAADPVNLNVEIEGVARVDVVTVIVLSNEIPRGCLRSG